MKIGVLIDELAPGGLQKVAIRECQGLTRLGHEVKLLVLSRRGGNQLRELTKNIKIEYLEKRLSPWQRLSFKFPIFAYFSLFHLTYPLFLPRKIKKNEFDVILAHGTFVCPTALGIKKARDIPVVSFIWDTSSYIIPKAYATTFLRFLFPLLLPLARFLDRSLVEKSDLVISSSPNDFADYLVPSAFDGPAKLPQKDYSSGYFLSVTKWNRGKNPYFLLDVFEGVPGAELIIAGAWEDEEFLYNFEEEVRRRDLGRRVKLISQVTENGLRNLYRKARGFVYPNLEAFGMGALEAAAYANPIIMPRGSGVLQFLDSNSGIFPKEGDLKAFSIALQSLIASPSRAETMGEKAFLSAKNLSWTNHVSKIEKALKEAALKKMLVFNLGFMSEKAISGGDVLFMDLVRGLPEALSALGKSDLKITVVTPKKGMVHWRGLGKLKHVEFQVLPPNLFDSFEGPAAAFCTYIVRGFQALRLKGKYNFYYSCSDVWPDIFPPFLLRFLRPKTTWISRIYHVYLTPFKRRGSLLVNFVSVSLQRVSWAMMRARSQKILALNQKLAKDLEKFGFSDLPVLGAGIDLKSIKAIGPSGKKYEAVFVGRLSRTKGVYDLLNIWGLVCKVLPKARLAVVGGGPATLRVELEKLAGEKGLAKNIDFLGFVPNKEKYAVLKSAKVFLLPSHEEGWGIVAAEAMACGLPVIGYNLDIFGTVYKEGFLTAPIFDTQAFSQRVLKLLKSPSKRRFLSRAALAESARFDNSLIASQFAQIL